MQHIEKNNDDGETFWKYKRISGHEGPLNKNHSSWKGDKYNVKVEWENGEVSYEPLQTIASNDHVVVCAIYGKDHGLLNTDGWKRTGLIKFHLGCNFFLDKEGFSCFPPCKYIDKLIASCERMFGSKLKTNKITSPLVKEDHPTIDDSAFLEEEGIQKYQSLIRQLQWAISLGIFDIAVVIMTMISAFRSAPRKRNLAWVMQIYGYLSKMRYSAIQICTEEPDSSDIPRTEYDWELSVYRGAREELLEDAPKSLGKHNGLLDTNGWKRCHRLTKRAKKMLCMVNQSKLWPYKTSKKYMYGFKISLLGYEDAMSLDKLHGNDKRQNATKLEMDQLHEYNTFHDKVIGTTPGEEFKKIRVHLLVCACNHRILSCSVLGGVTIFPYADKWTRAHVIG
jgi:hypothetical protein